MTRVLPACRSPFSVHVHLTKRGNEVTRMKAVGRAKLKLAGCSDERREKRRGQYRSTCCWKQWQCRRPEWKMTVDRSSSVVNQNVTVASHYTAGTPSELPLKHHTAFRAVATATGTFHLYYFILSLNQPH